MISRPIIATVWQVEEFSLAVAQMAQRTGTISLVEISSMTLSAAFSALQQIGARGEGVHLKVSPEASTGSGFTRIAGIAGDKRPVGRISPPIA